MKPWAIGRIMNTVKLMFPSIEGHTWDKDFKYPYIESATAVRTVHVQNKQLN
jgi:hypothetical protein